MRLIDILMPSTCAICNTVGPSVCDRCIGELKPAPRQVDRGVSGWAAIDYSDAAITLVNTFKERGRTGLARELAALADGIEIPRGATLVGLPSSPRSIRARGFVPGVVLAGQLAKRRGLRSENILELRAGVADQSALTRAQRAQNLSGAMRLRGLPSGEIWLIDDVVTTGASLREASRAIVEAGCVVGGFLAIAETLSKNDVASNK